jgi:molecular chaperone DnaK (HSP70)
MLLIQSSLREAFGDKVEVLERPELAVARGAALIAASAEAKESGHSVHAVYMPSIDESLPMGVGFQVSDVTTDRA